jgi:hypothetical protein
MSQLLKSHGGQPIFSHGVNIRESLEALRGQFDEHLATIGWMWSTLDQPSFFEQSNCDAHRLGADTFSCREFVRAHRPFAPKATNYSELRRRRPGFDPNASNAARNRLAKLECESCSGITVTIHFQ